MNSIYRGILVDQVEKNYGPSSRISKSKEKICFLRTTLYSVKSSLDPELEILMRLIKNHSNPHRHAKFWEKFKQVFYFAFGF